MNRVVTGFVAALVSVAVTPAWAAGDPAKGKTVFVQCAACHSLKAGENGIGPSLHGVLGRKSATLPDFHYSPSMVRAEITWDEAALRDYLPDPQAKVPGTKMTFLGVKDPAQLDDLIAYLKEATR